MKTNLILIAAVFGLTAGIARADMEEREVEERETFGKWHIGIGAAFNGGVKSHLGTRNLPMPRMYAVPAGSTKQNAWDRANARRYDGGGYIAYDDRPYSGPGYEKMTENWRLPVSDYLGSGVFSLGNAYQDVIGSSFSESCDNSSGAEMQYGISLEISRELWIYDENAEHRWGVDFAAAFSYFFQRNIYKADGTMTRVDRVQDGTIRTTVDDRSAMGEYDPAAVGSDDDPLPATGGMYGFGNAHFSGNAPALNLDSVGAPYDAGGPAHAVVSSYGYSARGDYQELEMLFMLRPWYEITDWWRVFAQVGVGVSWGRFSSTFSGYGVSGDENFNQWDVYGAAGLGTAFRYGRWDLTVDVLGRFLRRDLDVDGEYVNGSIERSPWGFRVMVGYSF